MATMPMPMAGATMPKAFAPGPAQPVMPVRTSGSPGPVLYAGATGPTGASMPMSARPAAPHMTQSPQMETSQAPNLLNVTQSGTPGAPTPVGAPGTPTGTFSGITPADARGVLHENQNYFGGGMGALLTNYLQTGAGYNAPLAQQTITATQNAMQQQINQQYGALQTSMANAGLSPESSGFQLGQAEFLSNASAQENQVAAQQYMQMYSQSQQDYLQAMLAMAGVNATGTANQKTFMGGLGAFLTGGIGGLSQYEGGAAGMAGAYQTFNPSQMAGMYAATGGMF